MHDTSPETLRISSTTFAQGQTLPSSVVFDGMGCKGGNRSPHLAWSDVPEGTQSFAVICHDPDAPTGVGFFHWILANIPVGVRELAEGAGNAGAASMPSGAVSGVSDFGAVGYGGPCPPPGDAPHHYRFTVYALKSKLPVDATLGGAKLRFMTRGNLLATGTIVGLYGR
ncbi:MAG: YbhB/YbcL family Raf kinase inhibitor-like protein [Candidatus Eremiobacteraeota bacterium]|nr:YbhB/YbcL family Raf kinase inhibitor-like protein [Candidatus Eremiobacteraeota bacterium]